jgi:hypothetical protein
LSALNQRSDGDVLSHIPLFDNVVIYRRVCLQRKKNPAGVQNGLIRAIFCNGTKNNPFLSKNPGDFLNTNSKETN